MSDQFIHDNDPEFNVFVEEALNDIGTRAEAQGICTECLSDRLVVEIVSGMVRSGVSVSAILAMVAEGIEIAQATEADQNMVPARKMH